MTDDEPTWLRTVAPAETTEAEQILHGAVRDALARWGPVIEAFNRAITEATQRIAQAMAPELARIHEQAVAAGIVPEPLPDDPAERALQLRRRRNTGPAVHADPRRNRR